MTVLEDHVWNTTANGSIFLNGDFEGADGQAAHMDHDFAPEYPNAEEAISLVDL